MLSKPPKRGDLYCICTNILNHSSNSVAIRRVIQDVRASVDIQKFWFTGELDLSGEPEFHSRGSSSASSPTRVREHTPHVWNPSPTPVWWRHCRTLSAALCVSSVGILIRYAYRTVELSQVFQGPLAVSEGLFYGVDTFPLLLAIMVYVPFWPGQLINEESALVFAVPKEDKEGALDGAVEEGKYKASV
ncbi:hypothetical protein JB92DRAFT_3104855 [Gautieria morchelliformis]|nr:hypothetical protein JB92DRAFT_3104855 [Gautieria morchelliformis]